MKNILIIHDDSLIIDNLKGALKGLGCNVKTTDSGFKGILILNKEHFDIIIIDFLSSGFDGKEVAKHVRFMWTSCIPFIIGLSEKSNSIKNNEFDRIFRSPISTNDLVEILNYCNNTRIF